MLRGKYRIPFYMSTDCENLLKKFLILNPTKRGTLEVRDLGGVGGGRPTGAPPIWSWDPLEWSWTPLRVPRDPKHSPGSPRNPQHGPGST